MIPSADILSPDLQAVLRLQPDIAYRRLLAGEANEASRPALQSLQEDQLINVPVRSADDARALLAGAWLWHDFLPESHQLAQQISSATGSYWHAIVHRREADFSNSKYWYARCAAHPILATLGVLAAQIVNPLPADRGLLRLTRSGFDPAVFVDMVQELHDQGEDPRHAALVQIQQIEWRVLFDHCVRAAAGR